MRVTLGTTNRHPKPDRSHGVGPVDRLLEEILFGIRTPFRVVKRVAMKAAGDKVVTRLGIHQVTRQLTTGKLVEWHVGVQRLDDPVPIAPGKRTCPILFVTIAVRVAR